ncbi:MAG: hypothetical protein ACTILK_00255 [Bifidobacterium crudilactis]|uniref:hypothetical protein n=1 Tax=Bifidobacterium crudilactis TaxID=327277 RepID=UPI003F96E11B
MRGVRRQIEAGWDDWDIEPAADTETLDAGTDVDADTGTCPPPSGEHQAAGSSDSNYATDEAQQPVSAHVGVGRPVLREQLEGSWEHWTVQPPVPAGSSAIAHTATDTGDGTLGDDDDADVLGAVAADAPGGVARGGRSRWLLVVALAGVLALGGTGAVGVTSAVRGVKATNLAESLASCEQELKRFKAALKNFDKAKADAAETVKITAEQVADGTTLEALTKAVKAQAPKSVACPAAGDTETLDANTALLAEQIGTVDSDIKAITDSATAVTESKTAKEVADAQQKLSDTITSGEQTLAESEGKVQDNAVREQLREALDNAIKTKDSKDVKALNDHAGNIAGKVQAVGEARAAKEQADTEAAQAQADADARANAGKQSTSNGGGSAKRKSGSSGSGTTTKKSTGSTPKPSPVAPSSHPPASSKPPARGDTGVSLG